MALLTDEQVVIALRGLPGWTREGNTLVRRYAFSSFLTAIAFINALAPLAEAANHHPELTNVYNRVTIALSTHDEGGITEKDVALAALIEDAADTILNPKSKI